MPQTIKITKRKAVDFDVFSSFCDYSSEHDYFKICSHPNNDNTDIVDGKEIAYCSCHSCPLGLMAEQIDIDNPADEDAADGEIDWNGFCSDGVVDEDNILLVCDDETATADERITLYFHDRYMHRYDESWLASHEPPDVENKKET